MMKLLIVDDSKAMRMIVRRALRQANLAEHQVDEATNGEEALEKLRTAGPFDLVLADWNMPQMNGIDLGCSIRGYVRQFRFRDVRGDGRYTRDGDAKWGTISHS